MLANIEVSLVPSKADEHNKVVLWNEGAETSTP